MRHLGWLLVSLFVVVADQATKAWAQQALLGRVIEVTGWFNLVLAYNTGAAFSFLHDAGGWQRGFFIAVGAVIAPLLVLWLARLGPGRRMEALGIALVLGGALGNLIDRIRLGHVVDFIDWHVAGWHWPAFNLADAAITAGAALLVLGGLRRKDHAG